MRKFATVLILTMFLAPALAGTACAASLRVAPSTLDVPPGSRVATLTLRNDGDGPAHYQIRVFRWVQERGEEHFEPADDVVVSPPITTIAPGLDYLARVIRLTDRPVTREETYRVIVDELPEVRKRTTKTVSFLVRYSIPLFFTQHMSIDAPLAWRFMRAGNRLVFQAHNPGQRRAKITNLRVRTARGRDIAIAKGLAGYVLAGGGRHWSLPAETLEGDEAVSLHFLNGREAVNVPVVLSGRH